MAKKIKIWIHPNGAKQIMRSAEVQAELRRRANRIASQAESMSGGSFDLNVKIKQTRATASVFAADYAAREAIYEQNILLRAVSAGGA